MIAVRGFLLVLPFVELAVGALMVLGLGMRYALIVGGFTITALTLARPLSKTGGQQGCSFLCDRVFHLLFCERV